MVDSAKPLPDELTDFVESGVTILVATTDQHLRPACMRALGAQVARDRRALTIFLPEATARATVANLASTRRIAIAFSRPLDHRAIQIKGTCLGTRVATTDDRAVQERYRAAYFEQLHAVGVPRNVARRVAWWPSVAVDVSVAEIFEQTPGPGAGRRLSP
jgi:hypothetical protein